MKWLLRRILCGCLAAVCFWFGTVFSDRRLLTEDLVGVVVMAAADTDQARMTAQCVLDAVAAFLQKNGALPAEETLATLSRITDGICTARGALRTEKISLHWEDLSGFRNASVPLPAGRYRAAKIVLGNGNGETLDCVVRRNCGRYGWIWTAERSLGELRMPERIDFCLRFLVVDILGRMEKMRGIG